MRLFALVAVATTLGGCARAPAPATSSGMELPYEVSKRERHAPTFSFTTDNVTEVMGIEPLSHVSLPDGDTELRIWLDFSIAIPQLLLRLVSHNNEAHGELVRWWQSTERPSDDPRLADFLAAQSEWAGTGCAEGIAGGDTVPATYSGWTVACKADFGLNEPDWSEVLTRLVNLGATVLPDPESLTPAPVLALDGMSLDVEVLSGATYRSYSYSNPESQPWPEADSAQAIIDEVLEVDRRQWTTRVPRGLFGSSVR